MNLYDDSHKILHQILCEVNNWYSYWISRNNEHVGINYTICYNKPRYDFAS